MLSIKWGKTSGIPYHLLLKWEFLLCMRYLVWTCENCEYQDIDTHMRHSDSGS